MDLRFGPDTYLSVFTWRYGSKAMRELWSLSRRAVLQRSIWVDAARAMHEAGIVTREQVEDLEAHQDDVDIGAVLAKEREIGHDVMAAILAFREQATVGGGIIHLGMTSEDNSSNLDIIILRAAVELIIGSLRSLLVSFADRIEEYADLRCCGYTHLQSATATTVGYRLAGYAQDLLLDLAQLKSLRTVLLGKGLKGATGTRASFTELLEGKAWDAEELERAFIRNIGLDGAYLITGQTYPRKVDTVVLNALQGLAQSLHRFGFDVRIQQSSPFNELSEPFRKGQVGSTAMPWKRNPVHSENLDSLTRVVPALAQVTWINAAFLGLDRTLDESANRRFILPTAFLLMDEALRRAQRIITGLVVKKRVIARNLTNFGLFIGIEALLMHLVETYGQDRQEMHELLRQASMDAWDIVEEEGRNPLVDLLHDRLPVRMEREEIIDCLEKGAFNVGDAPERAMELSVKVRKSTVSPS